MFDSKKFEKKIQENENREEKYKERKSDGK